MPRTQAGRLTLSYLIVFCIGIIASWAVVLWEPAGTIPITIAGVGTLLSGIAAFVCGLISVLRARERSLWVWIAVALGTLLVVFLIGEFATPG